ncbi:hypothetical protein [Nonomuraea soli]|uniref:Uncharacterized protein n=1 Tax=Nonomuraea soli TaxID=1032476 RepID=A0A7W0HQM8_9ACTN|nr:hypothetical protein [Nonomuraea soli]MBA2892104.1 hypothetical protein [Nonomuraea soli]
MEIRLTGTSAEVAVLHLRDVFTVSAASGLCSRATDSPVRVYLKLQTS